MTCYIIGDRTPVVQDVLVRHGVRVLQSHGWQTFRSKRSTILSMLLSVLPSDKPDFIWLHLDGRQSYAQTPLHRQATGGLSKLFSQAEQSRCMIVIDGPHHEVNWNQTLRQLFARHVEVSTVHWCGLGIRKINQEHRSNLVHAVHSV